jgi:hypothetical protein
MARSKPEQGERLARLPAGGVPDLQHQALVACQRAAVQAEQQAAPAQAAAGLLEVDPTALLAARSNVSVLHLHARMIHAASWQRYSPLV